MSAETIDMRLPEWRLFACQVSNILLDVSAETIDMRLPEWLFACQVSSLKSQVSYRISHISYLNVTFH